ncbi:MAG: glycosyltransferase family 9 protein [Bacteroidota bacterium]
MNEAILIIQTAFAGDLILTTPLIEAAAEKSPTAPIDVLCIPTTAALLANHPLVRRIIVYDKKTREPKLGILLRSLAREHYAVCLSPHRSFRSSLLAFATRAPRRIAFDRSAAAWMYTETVPYQKSWHEVDRNRSLLSGGERPEPAVCRPRLYPSSDDRAAIAALLQRCDPNNRGYICIAPGSVWATKRWTEEGFTDVVRYFASTHTVFLLGGKEDRDLCSRIASKSRGEEYPAGSVEPQSDNSQIINTAGELGFLASAVLVEGAGVIISNDSAPVHLASAMGTPVVEIYGATAPEFGFAPYGVPHRIVQRDDLECRPCAIHGGEKCPIGTFVCMKELTAERVIKAAEELLSEGK